MVFSFKQLRKSLMGVPEKKALAFSQGDTPAWQQLERSVLSAIAGYHMTLEDSSLETLTQRLNTIEPELRGFATEGAAMGLTGLDCFLPWKQRVKEFLNGHGGDHIYMVHIGVGEALARLRRHPEPFLAKFDPVLRWLILDGYGFHEGFFRRRRYIDKQTLPSHLSAYARRIFDQGLGRSIWFLKGAHVGNVVTAIGQFDQARHADLWSGIGVACAYAGGAERTAIEHLREQAGMYSPQLALGAAVVAKGRQLAKNPALHSDIACEVLCELSSAEAAHVTETAFQDLPINDSEPAFSILQQRIISQFEFAGQLLTP